MVCFSFYFSFFLFSFFLVFNGCFGRNHDVAPRAGGNGGPLLGEGRVHRFQHGLRHERNHNPRFVQRGEPLSPFVAGSVSSDVFTQHNEKAQYGRLQTMLVGGHLIF